MEPSDFTRVETLAIITALVAVLLSTALALRETTFARQFVAVVRNMFVAFTLVASAVLLYALATDGTRSFAEIGPYAAYYGILAVVATLLLRWLRNRTSNHPTLSP